MFSTPVCAWFFIVSNHLYSDIQFLPHSLAVHAVETKTKTSNIPLSDAMEGSYKRLRSIWEPRGVRFVRETNFAQQLKELVQGRGKLSLRGGSLLAPVVSFKTTKSVYLVQTLPYSPVHNPKNYL